MMDLPAKCWRGLLGSKQQYLSPPFKYTLECLTSTVMLEKGTNDSQRRNETAIGNICYNFLQRKLKGAYRYIIRIPVNIKTSTSNIRKCNLKDTAYNIQIKATKVSRDKFERKYARRKSFKCYLKIWRS